MVKLFANSGDPDQMPHYVLSDLGLHCLPITLLGVSRLQWVNIYKTIKPANIQCYKPFIILGHHVDNLFTSLCWFADRTNIHYSWTAEVATCQFLNRRGHSSCKHHSLKTDIYISYGEQHCQLQNSILKVFASHFKGRPFH